MNALDKFYDIQNFIFDVDGVLADLLMHVLENGAVTRRFNARDAFAIEYALSKNKRIVVITRGTSGGFIERLRYLGVKEVHSGTKDKATLIQWLSKTEGLDLGKTLYMGDDVPDYEAMRHVHLPCCPADATREILSISQYVSPYTGGNGCVRDVIEKVLTLQGLWFKF